MENTIGTEPDGISRTMRACRRPKIVECQLEKKTKLPRKVATESKKYIYIRAEISEAAQHKPSRMQQSNTELLQMRQRISSVLRILIKSRVVNN